MKHKKQAYDPADADTFDQSADLGAILLAALRQANRPLGIDELLRITRLARKKKRAVESTLYALQDAGTVVRSSSGWSAPEKMKQVEGILSVQQAGMGFVTPTTGGKDIFIHPAALGGAWHGDTVEVLVLPGRRGPSVEGRIVRVIHRAMQEIAAYAIRRQKDGSWLCTPANPRVQALFSLPPVRGKSTASKTSKPEPAALEPAALEPAALEPSAMEPAASDLSAGKPTIPSESDTASAPVGKGDLLLVHPTRETAPGLWEVELIVNLEHEDSPLAQERITKSNHQIPTAFPPAVLTAAAVFPEDPSGDDLHGREDLRDVPFVTIDGKTARDFDDAIHVETSGNGFRLRVAIADVAHYVRQGSALDAEARLRGNSCYFPLSVEPMLPEALSNGLCSLKPLVPRLVMVADIQLTQDGQQKKASFYPAVIISQGRLTYGQIQRALFLEDAAEQERLVQHLPMLAQAERLARARAARRTARGSLDFDMPEAGYVFSDNNELVGVSPRERHFGHKIIEECMIAANEAVAEFLEEHGQPCLYRVHEAPDPDKISALLNFLTFSGLAEQANVTTGNKRKQSTPSAKELRRVMDAVKGTAQEYVVARLMLRSMMQARYQPDNEGHYGLASAAYCHFTSPIRRYADLVVHRSLKNFLGNSADIKENPLTRTRLEGIATHINGTERNAVNAEREIQKRLSVLLMREHVGEIFFGTVSGILEFGFFVEIEEHMCEGMVRLATLHDDYYEYVPERQELRGRGTARVFRLGQKVKVEVTEVSVPRLEINLSLCEDSHRETARYQPFPSRTPKRRPTGAGAAKTTKGKAAPKRTPKEHTRRKKRSR